MSDERTLPWILFPLPAAQHRAYSFSGAIEYGLEPRAYRSMLHEQPMNVEALLDFKIWGKRPCLTCYFRDIRTGDKFCLSAFDNEHDRRYTPRDKDIDFSKPGIGNGLYLVTTVGTKKGGSVWAAARLLLAPDRKGEILERIAEVYVGSG